MKHDIEGKNDIKLLVDSFYNAIKYDKTLGYIFEDIMKVNWEIHLPKMYLFWENILFQTGGYNGRPFPPHLKVNTQKELTDLEFNRWIELFHETVDQLFIGEKANEIKTKSANIQQIWKMKFNYINQKNDILK